ncbi:Putative ribonuclease H protein At1g65750 [Linum perenne]
MGIAATQDLGRYLGVPLFHGRVNRNTYDFLLTRLDSKLAGWKANNLSLAGRVTLASSVLNSIPSYVLQTSALPVSTCEGIDRKIRDFIWVSMAGARKIHNIIWNIVCSPKSSGGLGLRSARELNQAFLMKLVWGVLTRPNEFWVKVLRSNYLKTTTDGWVLVRKRGFSATGRGMLKVWQNVENGLHWSIRNGNKARFWTDKWLDSGVVLIDKALNLDSIDPSVHVSDCCTPEGNWNLDFLVRHLQPSVIPQVIGMSTPKQNMGADCRVWGLEANGIFSVKSAYSLLKDIGVNDSDSNWRYVWNWRDPNKIKHFIWLASHNRLLTNEERNRRHLTD